MCDSIAPFKSGLGSKVWSEITCGELVKDQKVVLIPGESSIEDACGILLTHKISSAPVFDAETKSITGMFDIADLSALILLAVDREAPISEDGPEMRTENYAFNNSELHAALRKANLGSSIKVKIATDLSERNPFCTVSRETRLPQVLETLASGMHRVVVCNADGKICGIISQSSVVRYMREAALKLEKTAPLALHFSKSLQALNLGNQGTVHSISVDAIVIDALKQMSILKVSSLAIVNSSGRLVGNISLSDVKYILCYYKFSMLWHSVLQLVSYIDQQIGIEEGKDRYPVFDVTPTTTLGHTVDKIVATKSHRMWVVESKSPSSAGSPVGVVTLTNVIQSIISANVC